MERGNLKKIKELCGGNAPDLQDYVFVTSMDDIDEENIPDMDSNTWRISTIPMKAAAGTNPAGKWERWAVARTDNGYMGGKKDEHFNPKFEFFMEKLDEVKTFILSKARCGKLGVIAVDNNRKKRFMAYAEISFDESTKGKNGYKIEFTCGPVPEPLPFYEGPIVE